ncbi:acyclic terpene utilization AtuA family protein [Dietzia aerolata]|uniref:acyclic terpene utilization AtuA family protein n=1 Tax=Dietzia aerolata TaxID=595984 RepID=UPI0036339122
MTTSTRPLRIGNISASRADRATATAEFLAASTLDVVALDMLSDEAMLDLAAQRADGGPGYERTAVVQLRECLDLLGAVGERAAGPVGTGVGRATSVVVRENPGTTTTPAFASSRMPEPLTRRASPMSCGHWPASPASIYRWPASYPGR